MQKLVAAFPLYRQVSVPWFFQWLQMDKASVAATVATEGVYLPQAMENLVALAFKRCPDFDRLVVFEHDMLPPLDAFDHVATYSDEHDIVGSTYFGHTPPHDILAYRQVEGGYAALDGETVRDYVNNPGLYEVDAVAMGFTAIRRSVLENWDADVPMWVPSPPLVGHDLHFCNEARKQGFKIWLDSGLGCGHLSNIPVGHSHHAEAQASMDAPMFRKRCDQWEQRSVINVAAAEGHVPLHVI